MLTLIRELQRSQSRGLDLIVSLKTTDTAHLFTRSNFTALCTKLSPKQEQESSLLKTISALQSSATPVKPSITSGVHHEFVRAVQLRSVLLV